MSHEEGAGQTITFESVPFRKLLVSAKECNKVFVWKVSSEFLKLISQIRWIKFVKPSLFSGKLNNN